MTKIVKLPEVMALTSLSRSSIYSFISKNDFPPQIRLGERSVGWMVSEIENWIEKRAENRGAK